MPSKRYARLGSLAPLLLLLLLWPALADQAAAAAGLKIGVVNMSRALNVSEAGRRSKNILLVSKTQRENELKEKEKELTELRDSIQNNILLTAVARAEKEKELKRRTAELRSEVQNAQRELQGKERKLTESIFTQLKTVISLVAKEEKFDLVLDKGAAQVILFSRYKFTDITDKVIERFNGLNK